MTPPTTASSTLSVSNWRTSDARSAPSADSNRDFLHARRRAREQQIRDVRARDQQHEPDSAEQHEQRRSNLAGRHLVIVRSLQRPIVGGYEFGFFDAMLSANVFISAFAAVDGNRRSLIARSNSGIRCAAELSRLQAEARAAHDPVGVPSEDALERRRHHADRPDTARRSTRSVFRRPRDSRPN